MDARLPRGDRGPGHLHDLRTRPAKAGWTHSLGGHRDLDVLERLHGRRGSVGGACRPRGARPAVRRAAALVAALLALAVAAPSAQAGHRHKWDTQVFARIPKPGFPARAYVAPNHRVYEGTYVNPTGDNQHSRVLEYTVFGELLRSWTVHGQDLSGDHGVQVATSDSRGRLVLLDHTPARALLLNINTGKF